MPGCVRAGPLWRSGVISAASRGHKRQVESSRTAERGGARSRFSSLRGPPAAPMGAMRNTRISIIALQTIKTRINKMGGPVKWNITEWDVRAAQRVRAGWQQHRAGWVPDPSDVGGAEPRFFPVYRFIYSTRIGPDYITSDSEVRRSELMYSCRMTFPPCCCVFTYDYCSLPPSTLLISYKSY
ncbi:hypothetical protein F2P81_022132 [Scophthalmus maximus]|uniref:Uncharacterized protein n=1 Tax=Scophthalmus maximus TaxID=52904 RepID=A0A6A4S232_SCOMX|nr:hypothetical protein F2P81_022132 [Scophthalmus maximus]